MISIYGTTERNTSVQRRRRMLSSRPSRRLAAAALALVVTTALAMGWASGRRAGAPEAQRFASASSPQVTAAGDGAPAPQADSPERLQGGYPPPAPPTATPLPDGAGLFPPPRINFAIVNRASSPYRQLISTLETALAGRSGGAFSPWVDNTRAGLVLEYPGATEGFGVHLDPTAAGVIVDGLFATGSEPLVQGYFERPGCSGTAPSGPCWPIFVTTGWRGPVAMPTKDAAETIGPPTPADLPVGAAAWEIFADPTGPYWIAWWLGDGYHSLVERLVVEGHATYFVLR